jgi:hypothetical protein
MMDYSSMTIPRLHTEFVRLGNELSVIGAQRQEIRDIINTRKTEAAARIKLNTLTPMQRDALLQVLTEGE